MPWESGPRGRPYYTRTRRENGRVIREYVGVGEVGQRAAEEDEARRRQAEADREADRALAEEIRSLNELADLLELAGPTMVAAVNSPLRHGKITLGGAAMPIHDWTRVTAGTWHAFHLSWIAEIQEALNGGLLPADYYAQAEQIAGPFGPDVLTLQAADEETANGAPGASGGGGVAVATCPPRAPLVAEAEMYEYVLKRRTLVIRHASDDRIVALIELVSPGNKAAGHAFRSFVEKAVEALYRGYHLLIVDLFPPTRRDPNGIHAAIWGEFCDDAFALPAGKPLTLAAYSAGQRKRAYVESTAVGREMIDMALFLEPEVYVNVPLEATYRAAYRGVPRKWQRVLEEAPA
jgi:hypothetical protein